MKGRFTTVAVMAVTGALALQGVAHAVLPPQHPAGSDGHEWTTVQDVPSKVTGTYKGLKDKFAGKVSASFVDEEGLLEDGDASEVCVADRKVTVTKIKRSGEKVNVGSDRTNSTGNWSVAWGNSRGTYKAKVAQSEVLIREYYGGIDFYVTCNADGVSL